MTDEQEAKRRVREFLEARQTMRGQLDPEVISEIWVAGERHILTVSDLTTIGSLAHQ